MVKKITGINFKGASFENSTSLHFFDDARHKRVCLLYGRNGAGKSTISKAFSKIKGQEEEKIVYGKLIDSGENEVVLTDAERENIYVFNESFVDNNVRLQDDGLGTIVMLGTQGKWDDMIKRERGYLDKANQEYLLQKKKYDYYEGIKNPNSPEYIQNKISTVLKANDGWASRDAYVRGKKQNSRVTDDTYKQFVTRTPCKNRDELIVLFSKKKDELEQAKLGSGKIEPPATINIAMHCDEMVIVKLLAQKLEKPVFSERENYLFSLLSTEGREYIDEMALRMTNKYNKTCKYCLQPLNEEYKKDVLVEISNILNKKSDEHIAEIDKYRMDLLCVDMSAYEKLSEDTIKGCKNALDEFNEAIEVLNKSINTKISNVYEPVEYCFQGLLSLYEKLQRAFECLENERVEYNKSITDVNRIIRELDSINADIAFWDIKNLVGEFEKAKKEKQEESIKLQEIFKRIESHTEKIEEYEMHKRNVEIALDVINDGLKYIFFSEKRVAIEYKDEKYVLLVNGKRVRPSDISTGERNVIGLCYYFANIMNNKELEKVYNEEYILIIDDPVSSFDFENKVGIMSYLKYYLSRFLLGNTNTKLLLMTHDLQTCLDADKFIQEIMESCKKSFPNTGNHSYLKYELINQNLVEKNLGKNEYTTLMNAIYKFAKAKDDEGELVIGNIMRRVLEAFSTFEFRKSIVDVSNDKTILARIPEPYQKYYEHLMYRLVLNGESHLRDRVLTMSDLNFFEVITLEQKRRTARDILVFIYFLNKPHLLSHLREEEDVETHVKQWLEDIKLVSIH